MASQWWFRPSSLAFFLLLVPFLSFAADRNAQEAVGGVLDLRECEFTDFIYLSGEWEFTPADSDASVYLSVPGGWKDVLGSHYGEGTYRLRILMPEVALRGATIGSMFLPELSQAVEVRVDGALVFASGDFQNRTTDFTRRMFPLPVKDEITVTVHLGNYAFRRGGLSYLPMFGPPAVLHRYRETKIWIEAFYIGVFIFAAVYHLFLFSRKYQDRTALFLGLSALAMVLRGLVTGENPVAFLISDFSWAADYRIEYTTLYLNLAALLSFCRFTFPVHNRQINTLVRATAAVLVALALVSLVIPVSWVSRSIYLLESLVLFACILAEVFFLNAVRKRLPASLLFFLGGTAYIALGTFDAVYYLGGQAGLFNLTQLGQLVFVLAQTIVLSRLYGDAFHRAERLTTSLEEVVADRTADLERSNDMLHKEIEMRKEVEERLRVLSRTDPLTGAANRLKIDELLDHHHQMFLRFGTMYGLVMFDLDHFKMVNDQHGHEAGDRALQETVRVTRAVIRDCDIISRWGGEEFIVLMPMVDRNTLAIAAERIRAALESADIPPTEGLTASFGVAAPESSEESLRAVLLRADACLYRAKREGRNRVVM